MRRGLAVATLAAGLAACGLSIVGTMNSGESPTEDAAGDAGADVIGVGDDGGAGTDAMGDGDADADAGPVACAPCSVSCASACGTVCPGQAVCLTGTSPRCVGLAHCYDYPTGTGCNGQETTCWVCGPGGGPPFQVCGDGTCFGGAFGCPCSNASECPDDKDTCVNGRCVSCGATSATSGQTCKCNSGCKCGTDRCDNGSCQGC